jgi:hypothetical protein
MRSLAMVADDIPTIRRAPDRRHSTLRRWTATTPIAWRFSMNPTSDVTNVCRWNEAVAAINKSASVKTMLGLWTFARAQSSAA